MHENNKYFKEINVKNWEECQSQFTDLLQYRGSLCQDTERTHISRLLYRGQANSEWKLTTTLERYFKPDVFLEDYYSIISAARPQIESFTSKVWGIPEYSEPDDFFIGSKLPAYDYMVYLRHHGFPSPLLDWTRSPFIAAFFAFHDVAYEGQAVSIYSHMEWAGRGKTHAGNDPIISGIGPYIITHPRHFLQQSEYTICTVRSNEKHYFAYHESAFSENKEEQDLLWKINIPSSERFKVLSYLDSMNINAFSLFGSEESLMATLALREFYFRTREI
jgi:hypothetical protein